MNYLGVNMHLVKLIMRFKPTHSICVLPLELNLHLNKKVLGFNFLRPTTVQRTKKRDVLIKLNMANAFDKVHLNFLYKVTRKFRFSEEDLFGKRIYRESLCCHPNQWYMIYWLIYLCCQEELGIALNFHHIYISG